MICEENHSYEKSQVKDYWKGVAVCPICHPFGFLGYDHDKRRPQIQTETAASNANFLNMTQGSDPLQNNEPEQNLNQVFYSDGTPSREVE